MEITEDIKARLQDISTNELMGLAITANYLNIHPLFNDIIKQLGSRLLKMSDLDTHLACENYTKLNADIRVLVRNYINKSKSSISFWFARHVSKSTINLNYPLLLEGYSIDKIIWDTNSSSFTACHHKRSRFGILFKINLNASKLGGVSRDHNFNNPPYNISPDGLKSASWASHDRTIVIRCTESNNELKKIGRRIGRFSNVSWSPDSTKIVSVSSDASIEIWDVDSEKCIETICFDKEKCVCSVSWSPDGKKIAVGFINGELKIIDIDLELLELVNNQNLLTLEQALFLEYAYYCCIHTGEIIDLTKHNFARILATLPTSVQTIIRSTLSIKDFRYDITHFWSNRTTLEKVAILGLGGIGIASLGYLAYKKCR